MHTGDVLVFQLFISIANTSKMQKIQKIIGLWLAVLSIFMMYKGAAIFSVTSGYVQGSEFGMLITLANQLSLVMLWLASFALWKVAPSFVPTATNDTTELASAQVSAE